MTEKEKMLRSLPYFANDPELVREREIAKEIVFDLNNLRPTELSRRIELLTTLLGKTKNKFYIEPPFRCDYGYNIELGENFYANYNLVILDCARVVIGDNVFIGPNVGIYTAGHPIHHTIRNTEIEHALPITIGNNVWIGGHVVLNPGVTIGNNTVIGSGSVVTKNIPDSVVAVGNPCKVLRKVTKSDRDID
jgi:galactoside O-acetyltransferase